VTCHARTRGLGPRKVSVDEVPDATIERPTDALIKITTSNISGSDLQMYGAAPRWCGSISVCHDGFSLRTACLTVSTIRVGAVVPSTAGDGLFPLPRGGVVHLRVVLRQVALDSVDVARGQVDAAA
jgi:hypothetical protein